MAACTFVQLPPTGKVFVRDQIKTDYGMVPPPTDGLTEDIPMSGKES